MVEPESFPLKWWDERWCNEQIGWHSSSYHRFLPAFFSQISFTDNSTFNRVLLPLCGGTCDLRFFADLPFVSEVVGVEFSETGAKRFFEEAGVLFERVEEDNIVCLESREAGNLEKVKIYIGDFLDNEKLFQQARGKEGFDLIFDRGSLVAINVEDRQK